MPVDGKAEVRWYKRHKEQRSNFDTRWERMAPYIAPSRVGIISERAIGISQVREVTDSTTMMAAELMAMFVAGHLINPAQQWGTMRMQDPTVADDDEVKEWLEESRDRMLRDFSNSLFYAEGPESLVDWGGFGTGFLFGEERPPSVNIREQGFRGMAWRAIKTGRFVIEDGPDGIVHAAGFEMKVTAQMAKDRFGENKLPEKMKRALQEGKPQEPFKIIHTIRPRSFAQQRAGGGALGMPWASVWVEQDGGDVLRESGYRKFPAAVPRYHRTPGEVFGRGRGDLAFPDTWTLNTAKRMSFEDWALKIRPPVLMRHDAVIGTLKLVPAGPTSVNTHGQSIRDALMPWETGSNPQVNNLNEENLRKSIRQLFFVDQILALLEVSKSEMTAFEFAKKIELLFRLIGPVYGRAEKEYLRQIWDLEFDTMLEAGAFSPPPPQVQDTDGIIDVEFQNPLAKAQRSGDAEALGLALADLAPAMQASQGVLQEFEDRLDASKAVNGIFAIRGVPASWTRSDDEVNARKQGRVEQQQQQLALDQAQQTGEALGKTAPFLKAINETQAGAA